MTRKDLVKKTGIGQPLFAVKTPMGFPVRTTAGYWKIITTVKHPSMKKKGPAVRKCLSEPDEVRLSRKDKKVFLFYRRLKQKRLCVVVKHEGEQSYIITSYMTEKIKEGETIWKK